jgi:hypothetical protein
MSLVAYRLAADWLAAQSRAIRRTSREPTLPTPQQYALLLRMCGSAGMVAAANAVQYISRRDRPAAPPLIFRALIATTIILVLTNAVQLVDVWLHQSTQSVFVTVSQSLDIRLYGSAINTTLCPGPFSAANGSSLFLPGSNCLSEYLPNFPPFWAQAAGDTVLEGQLTSLNISAINRVLLTTDGTAFLVPAGLDSTVDFNATSVGMAATCQMVDPPCIDEVEQSHCSPNQFPGLVPNTNSDYYFSDSSV